MKKIVFGILCIIAIAVVTYLLTAGVPASLTVETAEDTAVTLPLEKPLFGADFALAETPANGECKRSGSDWQYVPNPDFNGSDAISFTHPKATDGKVVVTVEVTPVQDSPKVEPLTMTVIEGNQINLIPTITDADGDKLTYRITKQPTCGGVEQRGVGNRFILRYSALTPGSDYLEYLASDGVDETPGRIDVTVTPEPNPKVLLDSVKMRLVRESFISPVFVGGELTMDNRQVTINDADGKPIGSIIRLDSLQWFLAGSSADPPGLPLDPTAPTKLQISECDETGTVIVSRNRQVLWTELDFDDATLELTARVGDSLLLAKGETNGITFKVFPAAASPTEARSMVGTAEKPLILTFDAPGDHWIEKLKGTEALGKVKVSVIELAGPKELYGQLGKGFDLVLTANNLDPSKIHVDAMGMDIINPPKHRDERILLKAKPSRLKTIGICARLGETGPVVWYRPANVFELDTTGKQYIGAKGSTPTHLICELKLMVRPVYPKLTYRLRTRKYHHYPMNKSWTYDIPPEKFVLNEKTGWYEYVYDIYYNKTKRSTMHEATVFFDDQKVGGY